MEVSENMRKVRLIYQKRGRAKYISHLDMNRLFQRALKRSKLPVWYTQGFNPHMYIVFAAPLSLGVESAYDVVDFRVTEPLLFNEGIADAVRRVLPEDIKIIKATDPIMKISALSFADYSVIVNCDDENKKSLKNLLFADEILVKKTTKKKKIKIFDVKNKIFELKISDIDGGLEINMRLPCGSEENINPSLIFEKAVEEGIKFDILNIERGMLYSKSMQEFR